MLRERERERERGRGREREREREKEVTKKICYDRERETCITRERGHLTGTKLKDLASKQDMHGNVPTHRRALSAFDFRGLGLGFQVPGFGFRVSKLKGEVLPHKTLLAGP